MKRLLPRAWSTSALEPSSGTSEPKRRRRTPQIGLSTLLLATACIAAWGSVWLNYRQIEQLEQRISPMRSLARELMIKDREHVAVIQRQPEFYDQQIWHVYVPGDSYNLHLVTRDVEPRLRDSVAKYNGRGETAPLPAGRHVIELKSQFEEPQWVTRVLIDDQPVITVSEPKEWNGNVGSTGSGQFPEQADLPPDQPVVLFHRCFMIDDGNMGSKPPGGPSNGIVLWIDQLTRALPKP